MTAYTLLTRSDVSACLHLHYREKTENEERKHLLQFNLRWWYEISQNILIPKMLHKTVLIKAFRWALWHLYQKKVLTSIYFSPKNKLNSILKENVYCNLNRLTDSIIDGGSKVLNHLVH